VTEDIKDEEENIIYHERDEDFIFTVDGGDHFEYSGTEYVSLIGGDFIGGGGGLFQSKKPERIVEAKKIAGPDKTTPEQAPSCDPGGNSESSSSGPALGLAAGPATRILIGIGAAAGSATGLTIIVIGGITIGTLLENRGPKPAPNTNPYPPKPSPCPTPAARGPLTQPPERCNPDDQVGRICIYQCPSGRRFTSFVDNKGDKCPSSMIHP
jgi:hypothetical protein